MNKDRKLLSFCLIISVIFLILRIICFDNIDSLILSAELVSNLQDIEYFMDVEFWYVDFCNQLHFDNMFTIYSTIDMYQYSPLFLFVLKPFSLIHEIAVLLPIFISHFLTGIVIYKIKSQKWVVLSYFLNPIILFYANFSLLNTSLFLLFVMLSYYYIIKAKLNLSMIFLAIACMFKQFAIIVLPIYFIYIIKNCVYYKKINSYFAFFKFMLVFASVILLIMLPFLIMDIRGVFENMIAGGSFFEFDDLFHISANTPVNFAISIKYLSGYELNFLAILISKNILFIIAYMILLVISLRKEVFGIKQLTIAIIRTVFIFQLLYSRGTYKYYLVFAFAFISLCSNNYQRFFVNALLSILIIICYRYVYLFVILAILLIYRDRLLKQFDKINFNVNTIFLIAFLGILSYYFIFIPIGASIFVPIVISVILHKKEMKKHD